MKRALAGFGLFCCFSAMVWAQAGQFLEAPQYATGAAPLASASADFNGDGIPDLVVVNSQDSPATFSVLLGRGDGSFGARIDTQPVGGALAVATGDFNNDGKMDVVLAMPAFGGAGGVDVFIGNGDGTFVEGGLAPYTTLINTPKAIVTGDFNGDGHTDFAVANFASNDVTVYLARTDNSGTFIPPLVTFPVGNAPVAIAAGVLKTSLDLVVANSADNTVTVLTNDGAGNFTGSGAFATGGLPEGIAIGDYDGDGKQDVATANFNDSQISVLLGNGDGTLKAQTAFSTGVEQPNGISTADFNGDGEADLVVSNSGTNTVSMLLGRNDGTFPTHAEYWAGNSPGPMAIADFNSDGKVDIAAPDFSDNKIAVLLGNGDGSMQTHAQYSTGAAPTAVAYGDFNRDGKQDMVVANGGGGAGNTLSVLLGNGDGTFGASTSLGAGANPTAVATGDFNEDGNPDVVAANFNDGTVSLLLGNGDGTFQAQIAIAVGLNPGAIAVGDFDKNNHLDIMVSNSGDTDPPDVGVLLGKGDGTFQAQVKSGTGSSPGALAVGNLDGDVNSVPDVAVLLPAINKVATMAGIEDGTFQVPIGFDTDTNPAGLALGDFNADGTLDVAVANQFGGVAATGNLGVFLGSGGGNLNPMVLYDTGKGPSAVATSDFNGDGALDLATVNFVDNSVSLLSGIGDGTFTAAAVPSYGTGFSPVAMTVADFNNDGAPDLAVVNQVSNSASVLLNIGGTNITFTATPSSTSFGGLVTLTATVAASVRGAGTPSGTVNFLDGATTLGSATLSNGGATFQISTLAVGTHTLSAGFPGGGVFLAHNSASVTHTVSAAATTTVLTSSANPASIGQPVTLTAAVGGASAAVPGGSVTFNDGSTSLGSGTLNQAGVATLTTSTLAGGTHSITASYSGDVNYLASTSSVLSQVVGTPDFTLDAGAPSPASFAAGSSSTSPITLASVAGFADAVSLTCAVSPSATQGPTCTLDPASVTPSSAGVTSTLTVRTTAASAALSPPAASNVRFAFALLLPLLGLAVVGAGMGVSRRRLSVPVRILAGSLILAGLLALANCGGGSSGGGGGGSPGTPSGSYTITVTGTSGAIVKTADVQITVQ